MYTIAAWLYKTYLYWWLSGDVGNQHLHCDVFTVDIVLNMLYDVVWHPVGVQVQIILNGGTECILAHLVCQSVIIM